MRRWLLTDGQLGEPPPYYELMKAARWMGVPPWELARQPIFWRVWARTIEIAEAEAEQIRLERPPAAWWGS